MNESDRQNPRRLVRAIEVEKQISSRSEQDQITKQDTDSELLSEPIVTIGITDAMARIKQRIEQRVRDRFSNGAQSEVSALMARYDDWKSPAFTTTGVRELRAFLEDRITAEECLQHWALAELQYAKRQQTWWKKRPVTKWVSLQYSDYKQTAFEELITALEI
jgi:tRNA dimethylallyltransferase